MPGWSRTVPIQTQRVQTLAVVRQGDPVPFPFDFFHASNQALRDPRTDLMVPKTGSTVCFLSRYRSLSSAVCGVVL